MSKFGDPPLISFATYVSRVFEETLQTNIVKCNQSESCCDLKQTSTSADLLLLN